MPAMDNRDWEAFEIQRQARALEAQTDYFKYACSNICKSLGYLQNYLKDTALAKTLEDYASEYNIIGEKMSSKYLELSDVMNKWASAAISNYDRYTERNKANIEAMRDLLQRLGADS